MTEELRVDPAQGQGPPELIIKLSLQFLTWSDGITLSVVCTKWKELIDTDEVGRLLCLNVLKAHESHVAWRNEIGRSRDENYQDRMFFYKRHELLAKMMSRPLPHGRSYRDMYVLSQRMGHFMENHAHDGPDVPHPNNSYDQRSLREASIQDYVNIVRPTIERLRSVFNDQRKSERLMDINEMKERLLQHARRDDCMMLLRKKFTSIKKEELAEDIGRMMLMLATSNDLDKRLFLPSSPLASVSLRDAIEGLETIKGGEIAVQMSMQLNRTSSGMERPLTYLPGKKKLCDGLYWPINPVDSISFLIRQLFPIKYLAEWGDDYYDATKEGKEKMWDDMIHNFWLEMGEPMRHFLVTVFNEETDPRLTSVDHIPVNVPTLEVPIVTLKQIFGLPYEDFREKVSSRIWREIDPSLCEQIFEIYHQQAEAFCGAIQEEYHSVYSETSSLEYNAKLLLDIFLEVSPRDDDDNDLRFGGSLTSEACDTFVERMEGAMDRWNELIDLAKTDEDVLWDPKTISELETFEPMFSTFEYRCKGRTPTLEFCVPEIVTKFLTLTLSSTQKIPKFTLGDKVKKFWDDYILKYSKQLPYPESLERETRAIRLEQDFRTLSTYVHTRHHAMIALVPLLPHLSRQDCKRLLYALFIQGEPENDGSSRVHSRITFTHMFFRSLDTHFLEHLPCARGDDSDFSRLLDWHREQKRDYINNGEILEYTFGLPLPDNIISAMGEFMVENLYQEDGWINDVNRYKTDNLYRVKHFLVRFCYERPESADIVWDYLLDAVEDAIEVVEGFDWWEITEIQRFHWNRVISLLVSTCIDTRAKRSLSLLRRLYQGTPAALLYDNFIDFRALVKRIKEQPLILNDTLKYHQLRSDFYDV